MRKDRFGMETSPYDELEKKEHTVEVYGCPALNVRKEPHKNGDILAVVPEGAKLKVHKTIPDWHQVETEDGVIGHVMSKFTREA